MSELDSRYYIAFTGMIIILFLMTSIFNFLTGLLSITIILFFWVCAEFLDLSKCKQEVKE